MQTVQYTGTNEHVGWC